MTSDPARRQAWNILLALDERSIDRIDALPLGDLDRRDAGLARELASGVLRHGTFYLALCRPWLRGERQPAQLRRLLALGAHQLLVLDRIPPAAAIHATVALAKAVAPRLSGVVNAVLRRLAELRLETPLDDRPAPWARVPAAALPGEDSLRLGLPRRLLTDLAGTPPGGLDQLMWLTVPPPFCTRAVAPVAAHPAQRRRDGEWIWWADPAAALEGPVAAGTCVVQDPAQHAGLMLGAPRHGEIACDCCAAPGGKSLLLRAAGCVLAAGDLTAAKTARLLENGLAGCIVQQDARQPALAPGSCDLVVLDAPCSNSAVLARRPEAVLRIAPAPLKSLQALQRRLLARVADLVAPGGRLLYSTCSLTRSENRVIAAGLPGWRIEQDRTHWPDAWQQGGYAAVLRRS